MALTAKLRERLYEILEHPIMKEVVKEQNGRTTTYIVPANWSFSSIAKWSMSWTLETSTQGEAMQGPSYEFYDVSSVMNEALRELISRNRG